MNLFYIFFYDRIVKDLLLEEVRLNHPELTLSFSNDQFISMKGPVSYDDELKLRPVVFSKRQACFVAKSATEPENVEYLKISDNEYWIYTVIKTPNDFYGLPIMEKPLEAPARAYLKIKEAHEFFDMKFAKKDQVVEIGSAPGGISYYLLELGMKLVSIDPAVMDQKLSRDYPSSFLHIKKSIFDISNMDLPERCDWVISDLNLKGNIALEQSMRIMDYYPDLKGAFLTIKTPEISDVKRIIKWKLKLARKYKVQICHLPSHRREIGFIIKL